MKVVALYRQNSDHARHVLEFIEMLSRRYPDKKIIELDIDTRDGAAEAALYSIMQYPALLATANNGSVLGVWEGLPLPLIDEVAGLMVER